MPPNPHHPKATARDGGSADSAGAKNPPAAKAPATGQAGQAVSSRRAKALWLAVYLPWLAGEVVAHEDGRPLVISQESPRGWLVYRASPAAREHGICPGMTVSAAGVLCPGLAVQRRRPGRERRRLEALADRMTAFSPSVSLEEPETLLLEVRGSLGLFGGIDPLRERIAERLEAAGHAHRLAGAPTPSAAYCLARWGRERVVEDEAALRSILGPMPIALLGLEPKTLGRLERAGIRALRDLWRLPADGLARRFGTGLVRRLDQLRGRRPEPRVLREPPPHFSAVLELDWATDDLAHITQGVEYLLRQWVDYLRRGARGTTGFRIECRPEQGGEATRVEVGVRRISRDMDHLRRLAAERLSRTRLPGPVSELVLSSDRIHALPGRSGELFETGEETTMQWRQSEELLATHLGGEGLETLRPVADHRPGLAWSTTSGFRAPAGPATDTGRPLWLLDPPRPLSWPGKAAPGNGPRLVRGPERIETGWWDQRDQRRDYYVAADHRGRRLWVFRDLRRGRWYLHGLFA